MNVARALLALLAACFVLGAHPAAAATTLVRSQGAFAEAVSRAQAGDTILVANGTWRDFEMVVDAEGAPGAPILVAAETPGAVFLSGRSNLRIGGRHIVVKGLVFRDGYSPTGEVISFRRDAERLAFDTRVTEVVIENFNKPNRRETEIWVSLFGRNNRVDHSHFEGKLTTGVTLAVRLDAPNSNRNGHRIDHNYFGPRPPLGSNGGETIRIGTSHNSLEDSGTIVENNVFEECSGEVEIISNKSGANVFRGNVFYRSQGALTLRHGDGNLVERNVFIGGGAPNTGGVRIINANQTVRDNLFIDLKGRGFAGALVVMNGVPNSPLNRYHQVRNAQIHNNTFIDVREVTFGAGADAERSLAPAQSRVASNVFIGEGTRFAILSDMSGVRGADNLIAGAPSPDGLPGARPATLRVAARPSQFSAPKIAPATRHGARALGPILTRDAVGAPWWRKRAAAAPASVTRIEARPGTDAIARAAAQANGPTEILLAPGVYAETRTIEIDGPLTIRAATPGQAKIAFSASTLFALGGRGDLALSGLIVNGADAPDAFGNSVIRARQSSVGHNYAVRLSDTVFEKLDVNRGFAVVRIDQGAFVGALNVERASFSDVSGPAFALRGETEPSGAYNVESVEVRDSRFANIPAGALDVFRGGKDESTFGPRILLDSVVFDAVGVVGGSPSATLDGAQVLQLRALTLNGSPPLRVRIGVGEPQIAVEGRALDPNRDANLIEFLDQRSKP